jgi:hypothetical protein
MVIIKKKQEQKENKKNLGEGSCCQPSGSQLWELLRGGGRGVVACGYPTKERYC